MKDAADPRNAECSKLESDITELRSTYTLTSQKAIKHELENRKCFAELLALKDHKVGAGVPRGGVGFISAVR